MHGEVLARCHGAQMVQIVALHAFDEGHAESARSGTDLHRRSPARVPSGDRGRC